MVNKMRFPSWEAGWDGDTYRHKNCPLHELPEHGDLVDADELRAVAYERGKEYQCVAFVDPLDITLAPVIVPSNKEDAE
jgi:hypothetical protein